MSAQITFTIAGAGASQLKDRFSEEANKKGTSLSEWITDVLVEYLRKQNGKND